MDKDNKAGAFVIVALAVIYPIYTVLMNEPISFVHLLSFGVGISLLVAIPCHMMIDELEEKVEKLSSPLEFILGEIVYINGYVSTKSPDFILESSEETNKNEWNYFVKIFCASAEIIGISSDNYLVQLDIPVKIDDYEQNIFKVDKNKNIIFKRLEANNTK